MESLIKKLFDDTKANVKYAPNIEANSEYAFFQSVDEYILSSTGQDETGLARVVWNGHDVYSIVYVHLGASTVYILAFASGNQIFQSTYVLGVSCITYKHVGAQIA